MAAIYPFDYLRSSEDPDARKVVDVYLSVPESYRRLLPAEAFCRAAGVSPERVLEITSGCCDHFLTRRHTVLVITDSTEPFLE